VCVRLADPPLQALAALLKHAVPPVWIEHAGHNDIEARHMDVFAAAMAEFAAYLHHNGPVPVAAPPAASPSSFARLFSSFSSAS
jgi:hypothetical protein